MLDKYGKQIRAIIAWGSVVRDEFTEKSDIDLVIVADDTREPMDDDERDEINEFIRNNECGDMWDENGKWNVYKY